MGMLSTDMIEDNNDGFLMEMIATHIYLQKNGKKDIKMDEETKKRMEEIEQENAALRGCIGDVLVRALDYDGYNSVKGLKHLIDIMVEDLKSGYPERLVDYEQREVCPLCLRRKEEE